MITEDYVSYETAKLLKEKGFNEECRAFYVKSKECGIELFPAERSHNYNDNIYPRTSAPTIQMAMKWLREKEIFIEITHDIFPSSHTYKYHYSVFCTKLEFYYSSNAYNFYEEACEAAIKYCLENLI